MARSLPRSANSHIFDLDEFALSGMTQKQPMTADIKKANGRSRREESKEGNG